MADVRLISLALLLVACSDAGAQTPSAIKPPAGWTAQPAIAAAAKEALGKAKVDGVEAFGEPAMGCYAVAMALRGSGNAKELAEQVVKGLVETEPSKDKKKPPPKRKLEIKDIVKPTAEAGGVLSLSFESTPYRGRLRARVGKGTMQTLACFWSQREPVACEAACNGLLGVIQ